MKRPEVHHAEANLESTRIRDLARIYEVRNASRNEESDRHREMLARHKRELREANERARAANVLVEEARLELLGRLKLLTARRSIIVDRVLFRLQHDQTGFERIELDPAAVPVALQEDER